MHDPVVVRMAQGLCHLLRDVNDLAERQLHFAHQTLTQGVSVHVRHRVVQQPAGVTRVV